MFITEDNIDSFVKEAGSNGEIRISFKEFMSELVDSP